MEVYSQIHSWSTYVPLSLLKVLKAILFFAGFALLPPLIMMRRVLMDRRIRFLVLGVPVLMAGMAIEIFMLPHYLAPVHGGVLCHWIAGHAPPAGMEA